MQIEAHIVNAFVDERSGGNPAGVVINADRLTTPQKLAVAKRIGLSETAFVSTSERATVKLEFFTPTQQIAHCGHATIATFSLLRARGLVPLGALTKETVDGIRHIQVSANAVYMEQRAPTYHSIVPTSELAQRVAASLGLPLGRISNTHGLTVVNTGNAFLMVHLPDEHTVASLTPDFALVEAVSQALNLIGYYVFSQSTREPGRHAGARMFAPRYGIPEESATGTAAGPLACLLHDHLGIADRQIRIEQGWLMQPPSPSLIQIDLETNDAGVSLLMVGGAAHVDRSTIVDIE